MIKQDCPGCHNDGLRGTRGGIAICWTCLGHGHVFSHESENPLAAERLAVTQADAATRERARVQIESEDQMLRRQQEEMLEEALRMNF